MPYQIVMQYPGMEVEELEWEITDRQYLKYLVGEYRMVAGGEYPVWSRFQKPTRYYIAAGGGSVHSSEDLHTIKELVKLAGGTNPRTAQQFGWSNQPEVVTFSGYSAEERNVSRTLHDHGYMIIIHEKDW